MSGTMYSYLERIACAPKNNMKISFKERPILNQWGGDSVPGIVYGPGIEKNVPLEVNLKEFTKVYEKAGESSLISLESSEGTSKYLVLINEIQRDPLSSKMIHIDFYQPNLEKKVEVTVPLRFVGFPPAVKELGGTLVKNILEVDVKAFPQALPHDIEVNVDGLFTFDDVVTIADLKVAGEVEIMKELDEIVALVTPIEEEKELEPIEEDVEAVEKVQKKEKEIVEGEEE